MSSNRGYNEWDEGMEIGGDIAEVEENIRVEEGKERRKSERNITIKVPSSREKNVTGDIKKKGKAWKKTRKNRERKARGWRRTLWTSLSRNLTGDTMRLVLPPTDA